MTKIKLLALGVLIATSASAAHADGKFTLGAGVGSLSIRISNMMRMSIRCRSLVMRAKTSGSTVWAGGYYLWNDTNDKLSITAYWSPMYFKPGDSDSEQMRRLDKRKSTVMAGLSYVHNTPYGFLRTTIAGDTLDNSNGINWDLARLYRYTNGNLTLTPGIGVEWNSDNQNEYYYGVSRHESRRSGMRSYDPDSSWNPYLELSANYRFLGDWSVYGVARYTRLSDEITDSPMVDKSRSGLISTGITYTF